MLRPEDLNLGRRVMVPRERVSYGYPWAERYGTVVGLDSFMGLPPVISVLLDGEMAVVIGCKLSELDYE